MRREMWHEGKMLWNVSIEALIQEKVYADKPPFGSYPDVPRASNATAPTQQAVPALPVARNYETDIAHRLRLHATNMSLSQDLRDALTTGTSEADPFYRGMVAWKATAEAKDRELAAPKVDAVPAEQGAQDIWREEDEWLIKRISEILAGVAIALKGPELPRNRHGYQDWLRLPT